MTVHRVYCVIEDRQGLLYYKVELLQGMSVDPDQRDHYQGTHSQQVSMDNGQKDQCASLHVLVGIVLFLKLLEQTDFLRGVFLFR